MLRKAILAASLVLLFSGTGFSQEGQARPVEDLDVPSSGTRIFSETKRLLINVYAQEGRGLGVVSLSPGTPTTRMRRADNQALQGMLEVGDRITHVNGVQLDSLTTYYREMDSAGPTVTLTIVDKNTGRSWDWVVAPATVKAPVVPEPPVPAPGVARVLLIGLTDDEKIGKAIGISLTSLESMLKNEVAQLDLEVISGADCNARNIVGRVRAMGSRAKPADSLMVYYLGHGAYDRRFAAGDPSGGHFFDIPEGDLLRKTLFDNLLAQPGKLKVLFTDTCNVESISKIPKNAVLEARTMTVIGPTNLEKLLLYHKGYLDVSASSRDQFSWFSFRFGGWFTFKFVEQLPRHANWNEMLVNLKRESNALFQENRAMILRNPGGISPDTLAQIRGQAEMTPAVFRMSLAAEQTPRGGEERTIERTIQLLVPVE